MGENVCNLSGKDGKEVLWFNSKMLIPFFKWVKRCEWELYKIRYTNGQELIITSIISHQGKAVYSQRITTVHPLTSTVKI